MIPRRFFWLFDFVALFCAFVLAYGVTPSLVPFFHLPALAGPASLLDLPASFRGQLPPLAESVWILLVMTVPGLMVMTAAGGHRPLVNLTLLRIVLAALLSVFTGLSMIALVMFAFKSPGWSRLFIFIFALCSCVLLVGYRVILRQYFFARRAAGYYHKNVLLIGLPESIDWMIWYFAERVPRIDYRLYGYLKVRANQPDAVAGQPAGNHGAELESLGTVEQLGDLLIHRPIHEVIAIHPVENCEWMNQVIQDCDYLSTPLRVVPAALLVRETRSLRLLYHAEALHLPAVMLWPPHNWDSEALFFKRMLDIAVSGMLLILLSPLLVLIALAIKLTTPSLPVFYRWLVVGRNGVEFAGYKFTTMIPNADEIKNDLVSHNEMTGPVFKMKDDPRVTPLGKLLRKYSLNELPQLWSVLKGDMSLVGPRPAFRHELERYEFWHKRKLSIQPGITCLWQVSGRNRISNFDDWVKMDLEYIDNWSLWLDFKILVRTAKTVIAGTGW